MNQLIGKIVDYFDAEPEMIVVSLGRKNKSRQLRYQMKTVSKITDFSCDQNIIKPAVDHKLMDEQ